MQKLVFTNGGGNTIDLTSGNFGITNWEGLSGVGLNIQTQQVPFQDGGVFLDALMEQREITVTVAIQDNNNLSARYERKRELISALNPKLGEGVLVYTNDYLSRQIKAVPQLPIFENKNSNDAGTLKASVTFSCPSPYWEDLEDTVVDLGLGEIKTINNEGDVPTQVEISLLGNSVNPNIVNNTTEQNIQYIGTMDGKININTNFGKKGAFKVTEGTDIVITRGELDFIKCIYVSRYGKYFAIFEDGCFGTSQDGIQWQIKKIATQGDAIYVYDLCYSLEKNIFVVTGRGEIITSSDAENWKYTTNTGVMYGVTYNANTGEFIATGQMAINKSTDGVNWVKAINTLVLGKITTNGQIYVAVVSGTGNVRTSTNGTSYSTDYATGITSITQIFYSKKNSLFIVIGTGGEIATSTNGTTWTTRTSGTTQKLNNISEDKSGNVFVVGENGTILKSTNGTTWSSVDSEVSATLNTFVANGSIDEYIIGGNDFIILKSYDLVNWEDYELEATDFKSCAYCKNIGKYVVVGTGGKIMSSKDGMLWDKETSPVNTDLLSVCYCEQKKIIVAVGANGRIITSTDAEHWTIRNTNITSQLNAIIYDPTREKFFVAGNNNKVLTSQDAENWTTQTVGTETRHFLSIATSNNMILLITSQVIFKSTDGNTFTQTTNIPAITGKAVIYHKVLGVFAIIGTGNGTGLVITKDGETIDTTVLVDETSSGNNMFYSEELNLVFVVANYGNIFKSSELYNWSSIRHTVNKNLYGASFSNIKNLIFCGEDNSIVDITGDKEENVIQNISSTSDFGFRLNQGENELTLLENSGVLSANIKYRQKYIGV